MVWRIRRLTSVMVKVQFTASLPSSVTVTRRAPRSTEAPDEQLMASVDPAGVVSAVMV